MRLLPLVLWRNVSVPLEAPDEQFEINGALTHAWHAKPNLVPADDVDEGSMTVKFFRNRLPRDSMLMSLYKAYSNARTTRKEALNNMVQQKL